MDTITLIILGLMPALVIVAGLKDLTSMKIPNWISGALVLSFFPAALVVGLDPMIVATNVGIAALALVAGAGMFALRWLGGGDAKLIAAVCLWLGLSGSATFLLVTAVVGGLFSLGLIMARGTPGLAMLAGPSWMSRLLEPAGDIPYGVAISAGALMAFPTSALVQAFIAG